MPAPVTGLVRPAASPASSTSVCAEHAATAAACRPPGSGHRSDRGCRDPTRPLSIGESHAVARRCPSAGACAPGRRRRRGWRRRPSETASRSRRGCPAERKMSVASCGRASGTVICRVSTSSALTCPIARPATERGPSAPTMTPAAIVPPVGELTRPHHCAYGARLRRTGRRRRPLPPWRPARRRTPARSSMCPGKFAFTSGASSSTKVSIERIALPRRGREVADVDADDRRHELRALDRPAGLALAVDRDRRAAAPRRFRRGARARRAETYHQNVDVLGSHHAASDRCAGGA